MQDLLAIHMVRTTTMSTIISCHPRSKVHGTLAKRLQSILHHCTSAHWPKLFMMSKDPTFVVIFILRYVFWAWDGAFKALYRSVNQLVRSTTGNFNTEEYEYLIKFYQENNAFWHNGAQCIRELHDLQVCMLDYQQLLEHFHKSVVFVGETPNPAMNVKSISAEERRLLTDLLKNEVDGLLCDIDRLEGQRSMLSDRLQNAMNLVRHVMSVHYGLA